MNIGYWSILTTVQATVNMFYVSVKDETTQ